MDTAETKHVYKVIAEITGKLAKEGIEKNRKNQQQGYLFRGIDDIYNSIASLLSESGLCILPNVLERNCVERMTKSGTPLFYVTVKIDFSFVSIHDKSEHHIVTYGEAMDSADKATNKAMSAAYKYACLQTFCIPTEGDNDADQTTHEVASDLLIKMEEFAKNGMAVLEKKWHEINNDDRKSLRPYLNKLKNIAADHDAKRNETKPVSEMAV